MKHGEIAYIKSSDASVNLASGLFGAEASFPSAPKDSFNPLSQQEISQRFNANPILYWGSDNKFPQKLDELAKKVGILRQGLLRLMYYTYNQGIFTYRILEEAGDGTQKIEIVRDPKIERFFKESKIIQFLNDAIRDYFKYGQFFAVHMLSDSREIVRLRTHNAYKCRLEKPHPDTGRIEHVYVSGQWNTGFALSSSSIPEYMRNTVHKYPLLDLYDSVDQIEYGTDETYIQHVKHVSSEYDYGDHPWHAVFFNKWLNISASVPELKERLFMYAMTINYMIYIDDAYWKSVYGKENWESWDADTKSDKVKELQGSIERDLTGKDNAFKTMFANMRYTEAGKPDKAILIEAIDNKLREGTFIPDNLHANGEILAALGVDACLLGATVLGDKISAGSGSNIREAALNLVSLLRTDRDTILEPLRVVQQYNKWDDSIHFGFKDYIIGTQDGRDPVKGTEVKPA